MVLNSEIFSDFFGADSEIIALFFVGCIMFGLLYATEVLGKKGVN